MQRDPLCMWLVSVMVVGYCTDAFPAFAQITPDNTLPVNSNVRTNGLVHTVDGGTSRGVNLYHSFQDFSVLKNHTVYFNNALNVQNILTRVTGTSISNIDGTVRANGTANLFLLNPNGITFGANAKLDIGGTFVGTTSKSIKFADGSEFSAINPQAPPLLTTNITLGLQYGASKTGAAIASYGNLAAGQDLVLIADKLDLQGQLQAGRDLILRSPNPIVGDAYFFAGGDFRVENLNGGTGNLFSPNDPVILALGNVSFGDYLGASLHILAGGSVTLGNVTITGKGDVNTTINPQNTNFFNATKTYADLATVAVTDYQALKNSDGSVRDVVPIKIPIVIDGSAQAVLDVRSGIDWTQLGGLPTNPIVSGAIASSQNYSTPVANADITVKGKIRITQPRSLVLLTNQFTPNTLQGKISTQEIDVGTAVIGADAGDIRIYGRDDIVVNANLIAYSEPTFGNAGKGGSVAISTYSGNITMESDLFTDSFTLLGNTSNAGKISLSSYSGDINLDNIYFESSSFTYDGNSANAGDIELTSYSGNINITRPLWKSPSVSLKNGSSGNAGAAYFATYSGNITIKNARSFFGDKGTYLDTGTYSGSSSSGNGGAFALATNSGNISLINAPLNSSTASYASSKSAYAGNGGAISLATASGDIFLNDLTLYSYSFSPSTNTRNGGAISLYSGSGNIRLNNSTLSAYSFAPLASSQSGGTVSISTPQGNVISDLTSYILSFSISKLGFASGDGGEITLAAKNQISNLGLFTSSAFGQAGTVNIKGLDDLTIASLQVITSKTVNFPKRDYDINDPNTFITTIFGVGLSGRSGDVKITGAKNLNFDNTLILSTTKGIDPAGNIFITSPTSILFQNNSQVLSNTNSVGTAGNIFVVAGDAIAFRDNSQITAQTSSDGKAGNIDVKAKNAILFTAGTGLFANTTPGSKGDGGNITVDPLFVTLQDGAAIAVGSLGSGIGGSIAITANYLSLLNGSSISASTASSNGGNITLNVPNILLLRGGSQISTTAGTIQAGGNGGNINIEGGFIVGVKAEDSNIFANAFTGNGGSINIATSGIYGLDFRLQPTKSSDITASSEFGLQGNVIVTTPEVDPSRGLISLPVNLTDSSKEISQSCAVGGKLSSRNNSFTISGRGGLPKSPNDELSSIQPLVELAEVMPRSYRITDATDATDIDRNVAANLSPKSELKPNLGKEPPSSIIEANTIARDRNGKLRLMSAMNPLSSAIPQLSCTDGLAVN